MLWCNLLLAFLPLPTAFSFQFSPAARVSTRLPSQLGNEPLDRRTLLQDGTIAAGIALSTLLDPDSAIAIQPYDNKPKRILITGSNSGIGMDAAMRMATRGHEVVLACVSFV